MRERIDCAGFSNDWPKAGSGRTGSTAKPATQPEPIPLEKVRAVLADKARLGRTAEVKALLQKHGAQKLSEIDPREYANLLAEAEALR